MVFIVLALIIIGIVGMAIGFALVEREEREKQRKIIKMEIELAQAKEKLENHRLMVEAQRPKQEVS